MSVLAVDLGGSHVSTAVIEGRHVLAEQTFEIQAGKGETMLPLLEQSLRLCLRTAGVSPKSVRGVGIGYPGIVDSMQCEILAPLDKYADLTGQRLQTWARDRFHAPLRLENDARLALLGEAFAGGAQGLQDVVLVTLGTGIGGAAMLNGKLLVSQSGHAGALGGHLPVNLRGRLCACGAVGCAEAEASTAVLPELCRQWPRFAQSQLAAKPTLNFQTVFEAVGENDVVACEILAHCLHVWSVMTVGLVHAYGPGLVLFGGAILARGEQVLGPIRTYVHGHMWRTSHALPRIEAARLGRQAALLGAASLFPENA